MKTSHIVSLGALLSVMAAAPLHADQAEQRGWYAGISATQLNYDESDMDDLDLRAIQLQAGYRLNRYVALELRGGVGAGDDSFHENVFGVDVNGSVEVDYMASALVKGIIPLGPVELYGVAGYTKAQFDLSVRIPAYGISESESDSDGDLTYGLGVSFAPAESISLFVEYMNYYDEDSVEITGYNVGINAYF